MSTQPDTEALPPSELLYQLLASYEMYVSPSWLILNTLFRSIDSSFTCAVSVATSLHPSPTHHQLDILFQEDFGKTVDVLFKRFEYVPVAAASLAQVFRATTHQEQEVAVKVYS